MAGFDIQFRKDIFFAIEAPRKFLLALNLNLRDAELPFILWERVMQKPIKEPLWGLVDLEFSVVGFSFSIYIESPNTSAVHKQKKGTVVLNSVPIAL